MRDESPSTTTKKVYDADAPGLGLPISPVWKVHDIVVAKYHFLQILRRGGEGTIATMHWKNAVAVQRVKTLGTVATDWDRLSTLNFIEEGSQTITLTPGEAEALAKEAAGHDVTVTFDAAANDPPVGPPHE